MKSASFFDSSGRFSHCVTGPQELVIEPSAAVWAGGVAAGAFDDAYWLYGGVARKRRACPVALDGLQLRGVRPGSVIIINEQRYECVQGGDVELEFDQPGVYRVTVRRWPYLDGEFAIENPAQ